MNRAIFSSNAEELRYFAKQLLEDGKEHSIQEIKEFVTCHSKHSQDFTTGMYSGALRSLVQNSNGKYITVKRGSYQLAKVGKERENSNLKEKIINILEDSCKQIEDACTINIMNVDKRDLKAAQKAAELIILLKKAEAEFESF